MATWLIISRLMLQSKGTAGCVLTSISGQRRRDGHFRSYAGQRKCAWHVKIISAMSILTSTTLLDDDRKVNNNITASLLSYSCWFVGLIPCIASPGHETPLASGVSTN
eukprot:scaffold24755_cov130-Amphora_coffeaeformis.AAC.1